MIGPIVFFLRILAVLLKLGALVILAALYCALEFGEMIIHDLGEPLFNVLGDFVDTMDRHIASHFEPRTIRSTNPQ